MLLPIVVVAPVVDVWDFLGSARGCEYPGAGRAGELASGCLTSDDPNNLLAVGIVGRNFARGCPLVVDLGGYSHDLSRGPPSRRGRNADGAH